MYRIISGHDKFHQIPMYSKLFKLLKRNYLNKNTTKQWIRKHNKTKKASTAMKSLNVATTKSNTHKQITNKQLKIMKTTHTTCGVIVESLSMTTSLYPKNESKCTNVTKLQLPNYM